MKHWYSLLLVAGFVLAMSVRGYGVWRGSPESTAAMVISSLMMFAACVSCAVHLLGARAALKFVGLAVGLGWFFEETGARYGWWFGNYVYTGVEFAMGIPFMCAFGGWYNWTMGDPDDGGATA